MTWLLAGLWFLLLDLEFKCVDTPRTTEYLADGTRVTVSRTSGGTEFGVIRVGETHGAVPAGWKNETALLAQGCDVTQEQTSPFRFEFDPPARGMVLEVTQGGEGGTAQIICRDPRGNTVLSGYTGPCVQPNVCVLIALASWDYDVRVAFCEVWATYPGNTGAVSRVLVETRTRRDSEIKRKDMWR